MINNSNPYRKLHNTLVFLIEQLIIYNNSYHTGMQGIPNKPVEYQLQRMTFKNIQNKTIIENIQKYGQASGEKVLGDPFVHISLYKVLSNYKKTSHVWWLCLPLVSVYNGKLETCAWVSATHCWSMPSARKATHDIEAIFRATQDMIFRYLEQDNKFKRRF